MLKKETNKIKLPFWMKMVRLLFWIAILIDLAVLGLTVVSIEEFTFIRIVFSLSIIFSVFLYYRFLFQLPTAEEVTRKKNKGILKLDFLQLILFCLFFGFVLSLSSDSADEFIMYVHFIRSFIAFPWLIFWLLYFSFSRKVKTYYSEVVIVPEEEAKNENSKKNYFVRMQEKILYIISFDWIFFIRYIFFMTLFIWGVYELKEFFSDKRGSLDILLNLTFAGIHFYILWILREPKKDIPDRIAFLLSVALSSYFVHHLAGYFFYSEEFGEVNYHFVQSFFALTWCGFWIYLFSKSKKLTGLYVVE